MHKTSCKLDTIARPLSHPTSHAATGQGWMLPKEPKPMPICCICPSFIPIVRVHVHLGDRALVPDKFLQVQHRQLQGRKTPSLLRLRGIVWLPNHLGHSHSLGRGVVYANTYMFGYSLLLNANSQELGILPDSMILLFCPWPRSVLYRDQMLSPVHARLLLVSHLGFASARKLIPCSSYLSKTIRDVLVIYIHT